MSYKITGKLIQKGDTQVVSDKFKKREFVIEFTEEINGNQYTNFAKMQLAQAKCEILDKFNVGDSIECNFNIKGNKWEKDGKVNYITNIDCWSIYPNGQTNNGFQTNETSTVTLQAVAGTTSAPRQVPPTTDNDDASLPF